MSFPASTLCIDSLASYLALKRQENALIELRNDLQKIADRLAEYENYAWDMFQDIENVQKVITEVGTEKELKDGTILPIGHVMTSVVDMENIIGSIVKHEEHEEELTCLLDRSLKNFQQAGDSEKIQSAIERLRTEIYMDKSFFSNFTKTGVPYPKKDQEENMREGELQERKEVNDAYWSKVQKLNLNIGRFESKLSLLKDRKEEIDRANSSDPKHDTEIMVDVWGDPLPTGNDFGDIEQAIATTDTDDDDNDNDEQEEQNDKQAEGEASSIDPQSEATDVDALSASTDQTVTKFEALKIHDPADNEDDMI